MFEARIADFSVPVKIEILKILHAFQMFQTLVGYAGRLGQRK